MDKKDEVNEIVRLTNINYKNNFLRKDSQADKSDNNSNILSKTTQHNADNLDNRHKKIEVENKDDNVILINSNNSESKSNIKLSNNNREFKNINKKPLRNSIIGKPIEKKENKWGHRNRLRNRFRSGGMKGLTDYEALELLLFYTIEKIDTKSIAYDLIKEFGSIEKVFSENYERILSVLERDIRPTQLEREKTAFLIKFIRSLAILLWKRGTERKLTEKSITSGAQLLDYLKEYYNNYLETDMRDISYEQFRVIFLNSNNRILKDEVMFEGTINQTGVYPRQILKRALELNATAIIAVHNHPGGTLKPSNADISVTRSLQQACDTLGISFLDHLIIGDKFYSEDQQKSFYSFAENGLL